MRKDFPVNFVVKSVMSNGDVDLWAFEEYTEAVRHLAFLHVSRLVKEDEKAELVEMPIPLSHLLYYSGLREAGEALLFTWKRPYWLEEAR